MDMLINCKSTYQFYYYDSNFLLNLHSWCYFEITNNGINAICSRSMTWHVSMNNSFWTLILNKITSYIQDPCGSFSGWNLRIIELQLSNTFLFANCFWFNPIIILAAFDKYLFIFIAMCLARFLMCHCSCVQFIELKLPILDRNVDFDVARFREILSGLIEYFRNLYEIQTIKINWTGSSRLICDIFDLGNEQKWKTRCLNQL